LFFNHQPDENYIQFNIAMEAMDHWVSFFDLPISNI
jgi:hypothetical protein